MATIISILVIYAFIFTVSGFLWRNSRKENDLFMTGFWTCLIFGNAIDFTVAICKAIF